MTQNEVNIIKNSVLDATEAYVDARLNMADFVKTQIGVTVGTPTKDSNGKYHHKVKCNATNGTSGITYNNVLSVGNVEFPADSVVFMIAPNAQFSNQFILGKLDNTPTNIVGGSIKIGQIGNTSNYHFEVDKDGNLSIKDDSSNSIFSITNQGIVTMKKGSIQIGSVFKIDSSGYLAVGGTTSSAPFYVSSAGALTSTKGYIGGFEITTTSLGDPMGSGTAVGMIGHNYLYAWTSSSHIYMYPNQLTMDNAIIYLVYGSSNMKISSQQITRNSTDSVVWHSELSDERTKEDINEISSDKLKIFFNNLKPSSFVFKKEIQKQIEGINDKTHYGVIAQNLKKSLKKANLQIDNFVKQDMNTKYYMVDYQEFHGIELASIKDLYNIVKDQQKQIDDLRSKIEDSNG